MKEISLNKHERKFIMLFGFGWYYDWTLILLVPGIIIALWASINVKTTFNKYDKVLSRNRMTGAQVAEKVLHHHGIYNVRVEHVSGDLSDHYDPRTNVIRLSDSTYNSTSIAAAGVAAHEAGHAVQYAQSYAPIKFRASIVNVCNIGTPLAMVFLILGLFVQSQTASDALILIAILLYSLATVFQLVTLPVEFNASNRAIATLANDGYLESTEVPAVRKVLRAAAMTYVAAAAVSIMQLLRFIMLIASAKRNDD